ncbi:hypothetical protein [Polaromonas glacialis]|uniref:hypothetical protein n=1 Tax=Polaromonas glacialis TaxID=866564 RepID=UPI0012EB0F17|nr:hypothetical protein [Polaromonas glacialis]
MARRRRPKYFKSLWYLLPAVIAFGGVLFTDTVDSVLCARMPKTIDCAPMLPTWLHIAALCVAVVSIVWTAWAWYKDHVQGDYLVDLMHGTNRYRD